MKKVTDNGHSMGDVLKCFFQEIEGGNYGFSYDKIMAYLEELGGKDYAEEAKQIFYGTKQILLLGLEESRFNCYISLSKPVHCIFLK